jgi:hypothetical protein
MIPIYGLHDILLFWNNVPAREYMAIPTDEYKRIREQARSKREGK